MELLKRIILQESFVVDPTYVFGPVACAVLQGGAGFVACSQVWPVFGTGTLHRIWKINAKYEVTGHLDVPIVPAQDSGPLLVGVAEGKALFLRAGSFGGPFTVTGVSKSLLLDCTGSAPVIEKLGVRRTAVNDRAIYGDAFAAHEIRYCIETQRVYLLCEAIWGGFFASILQIFDAQTADQIGIQLVSDRSFDQIGLAIDPHRPHRVKCYADPASFIPDEFPNYDGENESENPNSPLSALGIFEYNTADLDEDGFAAWESYADVVLTQDAYDNFDWLHAATTPYAEEAFYLEDTGNQTGPGDDSAFYHLQRFDPRKTGVATTSPTTVIFDDVSFNDARLTRPQRTISTAETFPYPDGNWTWEMRELTWVDGVPHAESMILPWDDIAGNHDGLDGWLAGSFGLSHDPPTGLVIAGYGMLWQGFHDPHLSTAVIWIIKTPPDPSIRALRLGQRNDGLATNKHPRLPVAASAATSTQLTHAPRVGGKNTYT